MKCPHDDRGNLIKRKLRPYYPYGYFDCDLCGRGWLVQEDGSMISEGASDKEIYYPKTDTLLPFQSLETAVRIKDDA